MTTHEILTWAVPFFAVMTVIGAAFSITRLFSKRHPEKQEHSPQEHQTGFHGSRAAE